MVVRYICLYTINSREPCLHLWVYVFSFYLDPLGYSSLDPHHGGVELDELQEALGRGVGETPAQLEKAHLTLRVQSTPKYGICDTRNRKIGFGNILCIWILGPFGPSYNLG